MGQSEEIPGLWLLALKGPAGTGKSSLARALGRRLSWPVVDKDDVKDVLDGRTPEVGGLAYDVMWSVARRQLLQGLCVICDSPLAFACGYVRAKQIAHEAGARIAIVECTCPDDTIWRERIEGRKALALPAHHQRDWTVFRLSSASHPEAYPIEALHLVLDTTRELSDLVREGVDWLRQLTIDSPHSGPPDVQPSS
jgi:predicted kinase